METGWKPVLRSIPVMFRLVRPLKRHANIIGLFLCEFRQLHADLFEVQPGDFFVRR